MKDYNIYKIQETDIPEYHVSLKPDNNESFQEQLESLSSKLENIFEELNIKKEHLVFTKIFLSDYINQEQIFKNYKPFYDIINKSAISIIEQEPLDGSKINLLLFFIPIDDIKVENKGDNTYFIYIQNKLHIYQSINNFEKISPYEQTQEAFLRHIKLLSENKLTLKDNCIRTWLYCRDVDRDYLDVVRGRNNVFSAYGLTKETHFIASTGIGGKGLMPKSTVNIDFYSVQDIDHSQIKYLKALDYLNHTHEYGVAFERGTSVTYSDKKHIFISGTASIDKNGICLYREDVIKQMERLFLNIQMLLKDAKADLEDIAQMIVYLRDITDYSIIKNYLDHNFSTTPKVIVKGRVCRPEWLVEVECFAVKSI